MFTRVDFIRESNRIEGIHRDPTEAELAEYDRFMTLSLITIDDMKQFVSVYQSNARLRDRVGLNVYVGNHTPPPGGKIIHNKLREILEDACENASPEHAYRIHVAYETLHPFTDGNGRSGRMLWLWMMGRAPLGFLHHWYYQSLANSSERLK